MKEDESKLKDDNHIYDETSKYLEANFTEPPPPSYCTHPHSQVPVAAGASKTTYQPLLPPPRQPKDIPLDSPNYQSVGPPAGYAAPRVSGEAAMTRNDVPQPTTGGLRGVRGKPPNLDRTKAFQENQEHDEC